MNALYLIMSAIVLSLIIAGVYGYTLCLLLAIPLGLSIAWLIRIKLRGITKYNYMEIEVEPYPNLPNIKSGPILDYTIPNPTNIVPFTCKKA